MLTQGAGADCGVRGRCFPCGCEEPVAPPFDVPAFGAVAIREGGELDPRDEVESEAAMFAQAWFTVKSKNGSLPRPVFFGF